jgi:hypothetical protein
VEKDARKLDYDGKKVVFVVLCVFPLCLYVVSFLFCSIINQYRCPVPLPRISWRTLVWKKI